jgi:3-deoxy-manno-octulosonate cytidylyltransferase (CMP-KDO synthetase)
MSEIKILFLIPARYQSSRFPGKPLAEINGLPLIGHVMNKVNMVASALREYRVQSCAVTDDERILNKVEQLGFSSVLVKDETVSGTDRVKLAYERFFQKGSWDLVVNVQGDEPLINPKDLVKLIKFHVKSNFDLGTIYNEINYEEAKSPNKVKIAMAQNSGACLYFSRSIIPYDRDAQCGDRFFYGHVGVYSFRPASLIKMSELSETVLEKRECLEQLRALENGLTIGAVKSNNKLIGVDTPEDLNKVQEVLNEAN